MNIYMIIGRALFPSIVFPNIYHPVTQYRSGYLCLSVQLIEVVIAEDAVILISAEA